MTYSLGSEALKALGSAPDEDDGAEVILTATSRASTPLSPRGFGSGIWNAITDALFAVITLIVGQIIFLTFELGPAAAAAYLSGKSLLEIWGTQSLFHMTTGQVATVAALSTLAISGGLRVARIMRERMRGVLPRR